MCCRHADGLHPVRLDGCPVSVDAVGHPVVEYDMRAGGGQPFGDGAAHGTAGAGDNRHLADQPGHLASQLMQ